MNCDDKLPLLCSNFLITLYLNVSCGLCLIRRHVKNVFHICLKKWKKYCSQIKHSNDKMRTTKMAMLLMSRMIRSQIIDKNYKHVHSQMHKQSVSWTLFSFLLCEGREKRPHLWSSTLNFRIEDYIWDPFFLPNLFVF